MDSTPQSAYGGLKIASNLPSVKFVDLFYFRKTCHELGKGLTSGKIWY